MIKRYAVPGLAAAIVLLLVAVVYLLVQHGRQQDRIATLESGIAFVAAESALVQSGLSDIATPARQFVAELDTRLGELETATFSVDVAVMETLPIRTSIDFERTIEVPINTEIPINEVIDTTITVDGPLGVEIPIDVTVPVDVVVPIDLVVPFTVSETIPVNVDVPIDIEVPIDVSLADTPLADLAAEFRAGLSQVDEAFAALER